MPLAIFLAVLTFNLIRQKYFARQYQVYQEYLSLGIWINLFSSLINNIKNYVNSTKYPKNNYDNFRYKYGIPI